MVCGASDVIRCLHVALLKKIVLTAGVGFTALCLAGAWAIHKECVDETTMSRKVFIGDDCFIIPPGYGAGLGGRIGNTEMALMMLRMQYPSLAPFRETKEMYAQHPGQSEFDVFDLIDVSLQYKEPNNVSDEEIFRRNTQYDNPVKIGRTPDGYDVYKIVTGRLYSKDDGQRRTVISCVQLTDNDSAICHYIAPLWEKDEDKEFYDYALYLAFSKKYIPHLDELVSAVRQKVQSWHRRSIPKVESFPK